jgi:hypothetical protein
MMPKSVKRFSGDIILYFYRPAGIRFAPAEKAGQPEPAIAEVSRSVTCISGLFSPDAGNPGFCRRNPVATAAAINPRNIM